MGYFDGLASSSFKRDKSGNICFYPWGVLGKGYSLPDEATEQRIRGFVRRYYMISLPAIIVLGSVVGWLYAFVFLPILIVLYLMKCKSLTSDLSVVNEKLTIRESYTNSANAHNRTTLWLLLIFSLLFVAGGLFMIISDMSGFDKVVGLSCILFFGACGVALFYMIKAKST